MYGMDPRENNQNQPVSPEGGVNQTPAPRQEQEKKVNWFFSDGTQAQPGVSSPQESARQTQEEQQPKLEQVPPQQGAQFAFSSSSARLASRPKRKRTRPWSPWPVCWRAPCCWAAAVWAAHF